MKQIMKIRKWILGSIGIMAVVVGFAFAAYTSGYELSANGLVKIQDMPFAVGEYNAGYQVSNGSGNTYFIPTNSQMEWEAFKTNKPSGVSICDIRNGGWSDWSGWGGCSVSCGGGTQTRTKTCTNPSPDCGGAACIGSDTETQACNTQACYTYAWYQSGFGSCSTTCGSGTQSQTVYCQRNDGVSVSDSFCSGTKPATTTSCSESSGCTPVVTCPQPYAVTMGTGAPSGSPDCGSQCHDVKGGWGDFYACDGSPIQCIWYGACAPN